MTGQNLSTFAAFRTVSLISTLILCRSCEVRETSDNGVSDELELRRLSELFKEPDLHLIVRGPLTDQFRQVCQRHQMFHARVGNRAMERQPPDLPRDWRWTSPASVIRSPSSSRVSSCEVLDVRQARVGYLRAAHREFRELVQAFKVRQPVIGKIRPQEIQSY